MIFHTITKNSVCALFLSHVLSVMCLTSSLKKKLCWNLVWQKIYETRQAKSLSVISLWKLPEWQIFFFFFFFAEWQIFWTIFLFQRKKKLLWSELASCNHIHQIPKATKTTISICNLFTTPPLCTVGIIRKLCVVFTFHLNFKWLPFQNYTF